MDAADPQVQPRASSPADALDAASGSTANAGVIELGADDLPAYCPNPKMPLWATHPRVFLDVVNEREAMCPYCGTRYRLKPDTSVHDHGFGALNMHQDREQAIGKVDAKRATTAFARYHETPNLAGDASGNTRLELISRWLTGRWRS